MLIVLAIKLLLCYQLFTKEKSTKLDTTFICHFTDVPKIRVYP